jgi:hypothetical protein
METLIRHMRCYGFARSPIDQIGGSSKSFSPEGGWKVSVEQEGAHGVIEGADGPLSFAFLLRGVGAR